MRQRLRRWGAEPIMIPRWALTVKYSLFVVMGLSVAAAAAPSLSQLVSSESYTSVWGSVLAIAGVVSAFGSTSVRRERFERVGCTLVVSLLTVYALSPIVLVLQGDLDRLSFSVVAVVIMVLPLARLIQLIRGTAHG